MQPTSRREFLAVAGATLAAVSAQVSLAGSARPRQRVIIDNDFAGDPDGLYQTAHHLLCPSVDVRMLIGSHSHEAEDWGHGRISSTMHAARASELAKLVGGTRGLPILAGLDHGLATLGGPRSGPCAQAIIAEALREADGVPLYYAAGAGLTELANAWLLEPRIGPRIRLVWIGGSEYAGVTPPPGPHEAEYNLTIDIQAAQVIFNRSDIEIWQIPRNTYRQMLIGWGELESRSRKCGHLGSFLADSVAGIRQMLDSAPAAARLSAGDAYILGDSPLVTLTALQSPFQPDASSSAYEVRRCPAINDKGQYVVSKSGRNIRVYTRIDSRLTFEDMFARFGALV